MHRLSQIRSQLDEFAKRNMPSWGPSVLRALRLVVPILILAFLGYSLTKIGWTQVWRARPASLGFYVVILLPAFVQPLADLMIYRSLWNVGDALRLSVLLRKQYLNNSILGYSGEAYFFFWAQRNLDVRTDSLLHAIKDSNVLSGGAGLTMLWIVLAALMAAGAQDAPWISSLRLGSIVSICLVPLVLCLALFVGGKRVTTLSRGQMARTFAVHLARSSIVLVLTFFQWWLSGALPSALVCLEFVGMRFLFSRLPLVPYKGLVWVGVAITVAGMMHLSPARVAATLIMMTIADQFLGLSLVGVPWLIEQLPFRRKALEAVP